jgi:hypothetical protein
MNERRKAVMSEVVKPKPQPLDNFGSFDDSIQGVDDDGRSGGILAGLRLKFTNTARWETPDGVDYTGRELTVINVRRTEVYWSKDGLPKEVRELAPGEKYRDLDAVNESLPRSEWREGQDGKPCGPWQPQHVLELVNLEDMQRYSWPTSTIGGTRCICDLRDRILLMRRFRGENVYPKVRLTDTFMPTRHGGRQRPHLEIKGWIKIGAGETEALPPPQQQPAALPQTSLPAAPAERRLMQEQPTKTQPPTSEPTAKAQPVSEPAAKTQPASKPAVKTETVSEPTLAEEMNDALPY